jgi:hypothetical protein
MFKIIFLLNIITGVFAKVNPSNYIGFSISIEICPAIIKIIKK